MHHELEARTIKALEEQINNLNKNLKDMESDWAECARTGRSHCFFCANDDTCDGRDCDFVWQPHN